MEELDRIKPMIQKEFQVELSHTISIDEVKEVLAIHINQIINHHFDQLIEILYRIDISEKALRFLLHEHQYEDAGKLIAGMIIERQLQKIKSRKDLSKEDDIPSEDKW